MTSAVYGSDDEINPVTMLRLDEEDDSKGKKSPIPVQHQTYHLNSINCTVVIRQLPSQGLSFQLWPAAATFVKLLDSYNASNTDSFSAAITTVKSRSSQPLRILELGSGTGVVGIAAAAVLGADVTVTDLPHVLPNLTFNVDANSTILAARGGVVHVKALSWGKIDDMESIGREYEMIIGSDVVYHDNLFDDLIQTLKFVVLGEGEKVFLMAHLRRWKKESGFFKKAKKHFQVELVHEDGPSDDSRTGVVVYRFARKGAAVSDRIH